MRLDRRFASRATGAVVSALVLAAGSGNAQPPAIHFIPKTILAVGADLSISADPATIIHGAGGAPVSYTLTVRNRGPLAATQVRIEILIGGQSQQVQASGACAALPCTVGQIEAGGQVSIRVTQPVPAGAVTIVASVSAGQRDPQPQDNVTTITVRPGFALGPGLAFHGGGLPKAIPPPPKTLPPQQLEMAHPPTAAPPVGDTPPPAVQPATGPPPAADGKVFCAEVQQLVAPADCDAFKAQAQAVQAGLGAFKAPGSMLRGQTQLLQLAIGYQGGPSPAAVIANLPGQPGAIAPQVGRHMLAELSGEGFTITPAGPQQKEVVPGSVTTWEWAVRADAAGSHVLVLKTAVEAMGGDGKLQPLASTTLDTPILVKVGIVDIVRDWLNGLPAWLKSIQAAIVALAAVIAAVFGLIKVLKKRGES
ncbi:MAG: DUF11 domain-containing protein [Caulobacteraceae bacterium]